MAIQMHRKGFRITEIKRKMQHLMFAARNVKKKSHVIITFHGKYPLYRSDAFSAVLHNSLETMKHIIKMNVCWKGPFVRKWNENRF